MKFDGVIFDLDGVLCRTDELHLAAWRALASRLGIKLPPDAAERTRGVGRMESLDIVLGERSRGFSPAQKRALAEEKNALYRQYLLRLTPADAEPGARETLSALRRRGVKLAVASSSRNAPLIIERLALAPLLDAVVDGGMVLPQQAGPGGVPQSRRRAGPPARALRRGGGRPKRP